MPKPLDRLSARELQALYDKTFAIAHESTKALCATGRGNERGSETRAKNDPLALAYIRTHDAF